MARLRAAGRIQHPVLRALGMTLVFLLAAVVGFFSFALIKLQSNINSVDISEALGVRPTNAATADAETDQMPLNILLVGSDTRDDLEDPDEFGGTNGLTEGDNHSDTTILLHIAADRESAYGISIPRDSMVHRPDCDEPDAEPLEDTPVGMFNSAYNDGGIGCTVMTVEANTGVRVDHYAVVNFEGFRDMVDALGGVDLCVPEPIDDDTTGLSLPAGVSHLNGEESAKFVRARKGIGDGSDIGRIGRQQAFLSALVRESTDSKLLLRPDKLYSFLDAATKSVTVDPDLAGVRNLSELALQMKSMKPENIQFITVPTGAYLPDPNRVQWTDEADDIWAAARIDSPLPGQPGSRVGAPAPSASPTKSPAKPTVSPESLTVTVFNSTETAGLAKQAAAVLDAQGFLVSGYQAGVVGSHDGVVIRYPKGQDKAVATLAAAFPGADLQAEAGLTGYEVDLGPGSGEVEEVSNRIGRSPLPSQPIKAEKAVTPTATPQGDEPATSTLTPTVASEDPCGG